MPCYQVNTVSLDFQAGDLGLLRQAAAKLGLEVLESGGQREIVARSGVLVATLVKDKAACREVDVPLVNKLRVEYSKQIVNQACLKLGWQKVVKTENKLQLRKGV